jgi:hypothetical protein
MRVKINRFPGVGGCDGGLRGLEPRTIFVHLEPCDREESCEREALEPPPARRRSNPTNMANVSSINESTICNHTGNKSSTNYKNARDFSGTGKNCLAAVIRLELDYDF